MRWLILSLALLNLGYVTWVWHEGRLEADPYADMPPPPQAAGRVELVDAWLVHDAGDRGGSSEGSASGEPD